MADRTLTAVAGDTADPIRGLRAVAELRTLTDSLELAQVESALGQGMTWQQIADALGVPVLARHSALGDATTVALCWLALRGGRAPSLHGSRPPPR